MTLYSITTITEKIDKNRASHPSLIRKPDIDFRKLVNKLEQAEITVYPNK